MKPSLPTIKRLFAISGNRCAFPKCNATLIDGSTVVGEICHIKGHKPTAPRYDVSQSEAERHGFDNLLLLCSLHHTIIDDDDIAYTVDRVTRMKLEHEASSAPVPEPPSDLAERLVLTIANVASHRQSGGITAGVVNIHPQDVLALDRQRLGALLDGNASRPIQIANGVWEAASLTTMPTRWQPSTPLQIRAVRDETFELQVVRGGPRRVAIPYSSVRRHWITADSFLTLELRGKVILRTELGLVFEPE